MTSLLLPGWHGSGPDHWQRLWLEKDTQAIVVEQENWAEPELETWLACLHETVSAYPDALLVAHSLGVILVTHYVARYPDAKIKAALLVAPGDADLHAPNLPAIASFAPVPRKPLPFPSIMVVSETDPHMALERSVELGEALGSEIINIGDAGHINVEAGYGAWPLGHELAAKLQNEETQL
ncbi:RBBP9/YdeN family alpha/beta hydrolase [Brucellaceae bacterium C25G]